jgi:hypothetical protein
MMLFKDLQDVKEIKNLLVLRCGIGVSHTVLTPAAVTNNCHNNNKTKGVVLECPSLSTPAAVTLSLAFVRMGLLLLLLVLLFIYFLLIFAFKLPLCLVSWSRSSYTLLLFEATPSSCNGCLCHGLFMTL